MSNWVEKFEKNTATIETGEEEWELFEDREMTLRNHKHLEMAYEWLRKRGKIGLLKG